MSKNVMNNKDVENEDYAQGGRVGMKHNPNGNYYGNATENPNFLNAFNDAVRFDLNVPDNEKVKALHKEAHDNLGTTGTSYQDMRKFVREKGKDKGY